MASKLAVSPKFMAWIIARYREIEGLDEETVARLLGLDLYRLHRLAIFGRPRRELFNEDIETISEEAGAEPRALVELIRRVETIETFQMCSDSTNIGMIAAARDIAEEKPDYDSPPDEAETPPAERDDEQ